MSKIQRFKNQEVWLTVTHVDADGTENVLVNIKPDTLTIDRSLSRTSVRAAKQEPEVFTFSDMLPEFTD